MVSREGYLFAWATPGCRVRGTTSGGTPTTTNATPARTARDTRPPGVARNVAVAAQRQQPRSRAPGDNWYSGTVAKYRVTYRPSNTTVTVLPSGAAGTTQTLTVPAGTTSFTVQAVDAAGNLGRPRTVT